MLKAAWTGTRQTLAGSPWPYPALDPAQKAAAARRGANRLVAQPMTSDDAHNGGIEEPVNLIVTGSLDDLESTLKRTGWTPSAPRTPMNYIRQFFSVLLRHNNDPAGPISAQYLDGQLAVASFSKNVDYNWSRDHLRVYAMGTDPASGKPRWGVSASRDTGLSLTVPHPSLAGPRPWDWKLPGWDIGHTTDPALDGERDLVMGDLLKAGNVKDWALVTGQRPAGLDRPAPGGFEVANRFLTDGRVYDVSL